MTPSLVTVPNVPIVSTGIEYPLSTGPATFTAEDLADAVACQDDPAIVSPRLKLSLGGEHGPMINEPAFGRAVNLRLGDNDQTVYCDFVGVPVWLAELLPVAYPNRSIEGMQGVETVTGKKWGLVIEAVELLGVVWPGVSVLEDLPLYYGDEQPAEVTVSAARSMVGADEPLERASRDVPDLSAAVAASVNVDDVRRSYYDTLNSDQMWWWIRAIYLDPNELIVDDDDGTLYRVPFTVNGDAVEFTDPVEVKIEYVDVPRRAAAAVAVSALSAIRGNEKTQAIYASRAEARPDAKGDQMDPKKLRASIGLPEEATDAEVDAKLAELKAKAPAEEPEPAPEEQEPVPADQDDPDEPEEAEGDDVQASKPRIATVDAAQLERLKEDAELGVAARREQVAGRADALVKAAVEDGRIAPASKDDWRTAILPANATELVQSEVETLESLAAGRIPVDERGQTGSGEGQVDGHEDYMAQHFPQAVRRLSRRGTGVRHRQEV